MNPTQLSLKELVFLQNQIKKQADKSHLSSRQYGARTSRFKGRGMEFDEVRLYQAGDDVRQIDWKVTARAGITHTKLYREERDRPVWVCLDFSTSMFFATRKQYKSVLASKSAALQLWQALEHKDRCGGIIFNEQQQHIIKPSNNKKAVLHYLQICTEINNAGRVENTEVKYDINHTINDLRFLSKTGSLIIIISDFYSLDQAASDQLINLARHNHIVLHWVTDPFEMHIPEKDFAVSDGKKSFNLFASNKQQRDCYQQPYQQLKQRMKSLNNHPSIHCFILNTQNDASSIEPLSSL